MSRRNLKKVDKRMDQLRKEFKKSSLVLRKNKSALKKSATAARFAASLQAEPMLASAVTYMATLLALGGKNKKAIRSMLEGVYPNVDVTPLLESFDGLMEELEHEALMEDGADDLNNLKNLVEFEPVLMRMMALTEEFAFGSPQRLSVFSINEELKRAVKGEKGTTTTSKDQQLKSFFTFYDIFQKKLTELGVTDDAKTAKFLGSLMDLVPRIKIKRNAERSKNHGK